MSNYFFEHCIVHVFPLVSTSKAHEDGVITSVTDISLRMFLVDLLTLWDSKTMIRMLQTLFQTVTWQHFLWIKWCVTELEVPKEVSQGLRVTSDLAIKSSTAKHYGIGALKALSIWQEKQIQQVLVPYWLHILLREKLTGWNNLILYTPVIHGWPSATGPKLCTNCCVPFLFTVHRLLFPVIISLESPTSSPRWAC